MKEVPLQASGGADCGRILALDLGIGSYGIALQARKGESVPREYSFPVVRSCTLPAEWASLDQERTRRRMYRTREAHKARESWLRRVFGENGLEAAVLRGRQISMKRVKQPDKSNRYVLEKPGSYQLEREFPPREGERTRDGAPNDAAGARTVYCGAALRCLLLLGKAAQMEAQGRALEPWQVFKALHSAIQKRGYDPDIPWMNVRATPAADEANAKLKKGKKAAKAAATDENGGDDAATAAPVLSDEESQQHEEEQISRRRAEEMQAIIEGNAPENVRCQHPCFWEAARMGLWDKDEPERIRMKYDHHAQSTKWADREDPAAKKKKDGERREAKGGEPPNPDAHRMPAVYPRRMVESELLALCSAAEELLPQLAGKAAFIAYGPTEMPYPNIPRRDSAKEDEEKKRVAALAALPAELRDKFIRGKKPEWDAALGQKAPTFDNRCLGACALIPRFHVARVDIEQDRKKAIVADSLLAAEVSFLLQVKNFRFVPELPDGRDWLTPANMRKLRADHFMSTAVEGILEGKGGGHISQAAMGKWMETALHMQASAKPGHVKTSKKVVIEAPRSKGRSRFSRPALRIVRTLLLSGLSPKEFKTRLLNLDNAAEEITEGAETWGALRKAVKLVTLEGALNTDKMKGLRTEDTEFLERIGDSWENISIRDERLESYSDRAEANQMARNEAIEDLISSEINPRIRHRLTLLDHILEKDFMSEDRRPDRVVIEFAREGFLGEKAAKKKLEFQNAQRDERLEARLAIGANAKDKEILTWQLSREQGGKCLFCGKGFSGVGVEDVTNRDMGLDLAEQAHIVSKARGGPRAYMNLVLACRGCNRQQGTLYHADAFARGKFVGRDWDAFVGVVEKCSAMRPLKKKLLTTKSETEAAKMVQNRTALQETAWIAKLARTLICLKFGWPLDFKGQEKRIVIVTGAITNRVAQRYKLYRLLGPPGRIEEIEKSITQATERLRFLIDAGAEPAIRKKARKEVIDLQKELDDKCRDDKRHHGLDAMILSFLPHWAGDPGKNVYFGLPKDRNWYEFFKRYLDSLTPQELEFKKPVLRETIYGMRPSKEGEIQAAIRRPVLEMAYDGKTMEGELIKFGTGKLRSSIVKVRSDEIRLKLTEIADELDEIGGAREKELHWQRECGELRLTSDGPLIKRVSCWSDKPSKDNYQNMAKDWSEEGDLRYRGQWRCGKGSHQGQWLYLDSKRKPRIKAVKVFESVKAVRAALATSSECSEVIAFLQSGCVVEITQEVISGKQTLPPGRYRLGGVEEKARKLDLEKPDSTAFTKIPITSLLKAGFRRVDSKR